PPVELWVRVLRQRVPLPRPCERMRERADADRESERVGETATPRLQIRVAQPREPRIARRQVVDLLQEPERDTERCEGVRDRRVAPIEEAQPLTLCVDVRRVEVVVLNRLRYIVCGELAAQLHEAPPELAQPADLVELERQITLQEVLVARRQRCKPP